MKFKLDRIISIATLVASIVAITLVLRRPAPVVAPQPAVIVQQSAEQKAPQPSQDPQPTVSNDLSKPAAGSPAPPAAQSAATPAPAAKSDLPSSDGLSALIAKTLGGASAASLNPQAAVGAGEPNIKDQQVTMDGDVVHGKFLTEIGGKDVWVTISGHMGEKDGYATFDPTEFKVGDTEVPVSLVNPMLQRKLSEERDRLKISSNTGAQ